MGKILTGIRYPGRLLWYHYAPFFPAAKSPGILTAGQTGGEQATANLLSCYRAPQYHVIKAEISGALPRMH